MATFETEGKLAYMYDDATDTWHVLSGVSNTSINYAWTGAHSFSGVVTMSDVVTSQAGINNFQNASVRDAVITSPTNGTVVFVRQDPEGNTINQLQFYANGTWHSVADQASLSTKTSDYTLQLIDSGKTVLMNSSSANEVTIPLNSNVSFAIGDSIHIVQYGVGQTTVIAPYGLILNSRDSHRKIDGQYGRATVTKIATDTWLLYGDITT